MQGRRREGGEHLPLREGTSPPGDKLSEVPPPEPRPDNERLLKNFAFGDIGVPSRDSIDDSMLEPTIRDGGCSSSGVWGIVAHSWSSTKMKSAAMSIT